MLLMLDLTSAFDTVDHHILLNRLRCLIGVSGTALEWFSSYLYDRSLSVATFKYRSPLYPVHFGITQGSV